MSYCGDGKGEKMFQQYRQFKSIDELEELVKEMVTFARNQPSFDSEKVAKAAKENKLVQTEMVGPLLRVKGNASLEPIEKYNKFIMIGQHYLQVCYYEMETPKVGRVGQLTLVDNLKLPIEKELVYGFLSIFFDWNRKNEIRLMETPPHVAVAVQQIKEQENGAKR